jgi:hypothetical protein
MAVAFMTCARLKAASGHAWRPVIVTGKSENMFKVEVDEVNNIVVHKPDVPLTKADFVSAANVIEPHIEDADDKPACLIFGC